MSIFVINAMQQMSARLQNLDIAADEPEALALLLPVQIQGRLSQIPCKPSMQDIGCKRHASAATSTICCRPRLMLCPQGLKCMGLEARVSDPWQAIWHLIRLAQHLGRQHCSD